MEEHFNETYVESNTYPKAVFKGLIENFDVKQLSATVKDFVLNGTLELHGKVVPIKTKLQIKKLGSEIQISSQFTIISTDFNIKIPSVGKKNITNGIDTSVKFVLSASK
jgi:polyisoprenoid-binding protein YceI